MKPADIRRCAAETIGTFFLLATVVGSGIMAERLAGGNGALALLCNTLPTGAILVVMILAFGPISGAHFNPAVSIAFALRRQLPWDIAAAHIACQLAGAVPGAPGEGGQAVPPISSKMAMRGSALASLTSACPNTFW